MRAVPPGQVYFSMALTAAAVAFASPSLHWSSPAPAALDAAVTVPHRTGPQPSLAVPEPRALASYRAAHRPAAPAPSSPAQPRVSDDLESASVIPKPAPTPAHAQQPVQAPAAAPVPASAPYPSYTPVASQSGAYGPPGAQGGTSGFQACVIARESGGNPQVMNATDHYGLYQFSYSTWVAHGGNPADFGHASVAEQNQVFANTVAADGHSDWAPYDGCLRTSLRRSVLYSVS